MGSERLPVKVMHCSITGQRNQGRQPKKWIENIKQDIDMRNIGYNLTKRWKEEELTLFGYIQSEDSLLLITH